MNIATMLREAARSFPDRPALTHGSSRLTYAEFDQRSAAFAEWLRSVGGVPDGRVLLYLDNCPELLVAMFGTFRAGSTVVPCNARLTGEELAFIATDCDVRVIVADQAHLAVATATAVEASCVVVSVGERSTAQTPLPDRLSATNSAASSMAEGGTEPVPYAATVAVAGPLEPVAVDPSHTAWIFYTSGTTGRPKGAMLSHAVLDFVTVSWLADLTPARRNRRDPARRAAQPRRRLPRPRGHGTCRPPDHPRLGELRPGRSARADPRAGRHQHLDGADPDRDAHRGRAGRRVELPSLRYVVYGGAPMTPAAMTRALDRFGPIFVQLYGQGETPMTATVMRRQDHVPELLGSAGRPRPGIEVRIADAGGTAARRPARSASSSCAGRR